MILPIEVAITFDDLPGLNPYAIQHIMQILKKHEIAGVYGFMNGLKMLLGVEHQTILTDWITAGHKLANHTYSHLDLSQVTTDEYIIDIEKNAAILQTYSPQTIKYFRYPFLNEGETHVKRRQIRDYLTDNCYQIVPTTVYIEEYRWNNTFMECLIHNNQTGLAHLKNNLVKHALEMLDIACGYAELLFNKNIKHVLLLHETLFNAYILDDLLTAFKNAGVSFIPLATALSEDVYHIDPNVLGVEYYGLLGQLRAARNIKLNEKLLIATLNFIKRYSERYCSF
jgi:peptidoglycan/xylan/chitin deacetylase (PgdA/CDA1 family)